MDDRNQSGLTEKEVLLSRKKYGENTLTEKKRKGFFAQYLSSFGDPIIRILLCVLVVNFFFMLRGSSKAETVGVAVAVFLSTFVSTLSSYGSESAFEELKKAASRTNVKIKRSGGVGLYPVSEVVVGDLVLIGAGEKIPADGTLTFGRLSVDQSALNGESAEAEKTPVSAVSGAKKEGGELMQKNALFSGSVVSSGEGVMRVERVGNATFYGKLAKEMQEEPPETPLHLKLKKLAGTLSKIGYLAAVLVALADLFHSFFLLNGAKFLTSDFRDPKIFFPRLIHALTLAIAVVVVAVPEGLPMMIAVVLSANMVKMKKENVLVRKGAGIEAAGGLNILFTDKTGTLTQGKLSATRFFEGSGKLSSSFSGTTKSVRSLLEISALFNTGATLDQKNVPIGGNATDRALLACVSQAKEKSTGISVLQKIPFSSEKKFSAAYLKAEGGLPVFGGGATFFKGAPEKILPACVSCVGERGEIEPFQREKAEKVQREFAQNAMRVVAVAVANGNETDADKITAPLTFVALVGIFDAVRKEVPSAVKEVKGAKIQVVMITGDNLLTAQAVAHQTGILEGHGSEICLTGEELSALPDEKVLSLLPRLRVVARALPTDKSRLVRLAQKKGLVVGMTGDGINDAPALKKADVGFALGSGTDVAKEAGDVVILDDNFASIVKAVRYGRTIFRSIRKFVVFQLTMNFCAVGVSVICPLIGVETPVTVLQMLWINLIMDTLAGLAFSGEPALEEYMKEPPTGREESVVNRSAATKIAWTGIYTVALCLLFLKLPFFQNRFYYREDPVRFYTAFFALFVYSGLWSAFSARTERVNLLAHLKENKSFVAFIFVVALVQLVILYFGGTVFRTKALPLKKLCAVLLLSLSVLPVDILRKLLKKRKQRKRK